MKIADYQIGPGYPCFVIAEMGVNHNADLETALRLVGAAKDAGAQAVKVQYFKAERFCSPQAIYKDELQIDLFRRYELSQRFVARIALECKDQGIIFFGTPDTVSAGEFLRELGAPVMKVGSDDLVHHELIAGLAELRLPLILSTGMATREEIRQASRVVESVWAGHGKWPGLLLMHCVSLYPTPLHKANLLRIQSLDGYSDHTDGIAAAVAAVAIGAVVIEKHFTLDRGSAGPDHSFSADPQQFSEMVQGIRQVEQMLGTGEVDPGPEELAMRRVARRSIIAECDISEGQEIERKHLALKRPGTGLPPYELGRVVGRQAKRAILNGTILQWEDLE